ncbi:hypothetical protein JIN84_08830 [Luteolibacter yonseiensis]|uniref:Uncharacterized protein n=1 Tax=Luteolibacter yonseiensis TaxID=1144680 RepID=A0A934R5V5_9BACT|nr:hypothetical protein [Luteolibacter yonseiensis]MBK1815719.1 hypothetical protein [Luteolibacter yonseiensis]
MPDFPEMKLESALRNALPAWPADNDSNLFWIGLSCRFKYHNQPKIDVSSGGKSYNDFYCHPRHLIEKIRGFLEDSTGGSIMVTGYRGTGKTSLVAESIREIQDGISNGQLPPLVAPGCKGGLVPEPIILQVRVNLSTVSTPHEVLVLSIESLTQALDSKAPWNDINCDKFKKIKGDLADIVKGMNSSRVQKHIPPANPVFGQQESPSSKRGHEENSFKSEAISISQAKFRDCIAELREGTFSNKNEGKRYRIPMIIFVFDEIDKFRSLGNAVGEDGESSRIVQLQAIVAQLKSFLAEAKSHQIFVAGKDADDNWAEDQNKGEGVLESLFAANVYVPSVLSIGQLHPSRKDQLSLFGLPPSSNQDVAEPASRSGKPVTKDPEPPRRSEADSIPVKTRDLYHLMAREIGVSRKSMSYLTCFLIFPYLAEYEVYQLLKRIQKRHSNDPHALMGRQEILEKAITHLEEQLENSLYKETKPPRSLPPMSERTCRRLRTLMEYLTYKGRGIPRKILRELYSMVQPAPSDTADPNSLAKLYIRHKGLDSAEKEDGQGSKQTEPAPLNIIALPSHQIQRMSFYAAIMDTLDESFNEFSGMIDKQRVAIFHIVDHILKFYSTGFNRQDIEHASFMTTREEIYPGRPLAMTILRIMEGKLWKRRALAGDEFRLLHYVNHDLGVLFLCYAPEQMELRHTIADFRHEISSLDAAINAPAGMKSYHAQMRKGRIWELVGSHHEARLAYHRALEWIRSDLGHLWAGRDKNPMFPFTEPLVAHAIDCLLALGRLHEEVSENSDAVRIYEEIEHLYGSYTRQVGAICNSQAPGDRRALARSPARKTKGKKTITHPGRTPAAASGVMDDNVTHLLQTLLPGEMITTRHREDLQALLQKTPPVSPSSIKAADIGLIRSYNQASLCYAKMSERASGNERLLRALFHLDRIGDEQGMIDQMVLIAHVLLRRRDLRSASRWYLAALHRIHRIRQYSNLQPNTDPPRFRQQTGAEWQTPAVFKSSEAQIWAYLGDICHATNGVAFLDDPPSQPDPQRVESKLRSIIESLGCPVYENRILEYFFTAARHRFQEIGDRHSATNVLLRQLEFRMRQLRRNIRRLKDVQAGENPDAGKDPDECVVALFDLLTTWRGFWKSSRLALESQYIAPNSLSRNRSNFRGRPGDNRLIGNASRLVGEFLREISFFITIVQEVFAISTDDEGIPTFWRGITQGQLKSEGCKRADWLPRGMSAGHEKHIREIVLGEAPVLGYNHYRAIMSQILNVPASDETFGDRFGAGGSIRRTPSTLPGERGMGSPLFRVNTGSDEDPGKSGSVLVIEAVQRKIVEIFDASGEEDPAGFNILDDRLGVLGAAEAAVLHGYLYHRDSMSDFEQAMTTMEACSVYHSTLYLLELAFEPGGALASSASLRGNLHELQDILHEVAKRFAVNTIDILKREREQNRNTYALLSEAYFGLGELLLFRIKRILDSPGQTLPGKSGSDLVLADLWRQTWSAFRDGLYCILMEIEDLDHRYRLPAEVTHASGNLMDPVLHFRICRSVGQRHVSFRKQRMANAEIEGIINEINSAVSGVMPYGHDGDAWLQELAVRVDLASRLRTDRPTVQIIDSTPAAEVLSSTGTGIPAEGSHLSICFVDLDHFGRGHRFAYFGPTSEKDRGN